MIAKSSKIYIAGHRGMVGSDIVRRLHQPHQDKRSASTHAR
jgi:nucleoside-diphosphate-sugar epimerase